MTSDTKFIQVEITGSEWKNKNINEILDFHAIFPKHFYDSKEIVLVLPKKLSDEISGFAMANKGFPSNIKGDYLRMLYFSCTTITTLGFGDIVPLTSITRTFVALESILGIILIGLFLNSCWGGRRNGLIRGK